MSSSWNYYEILEVQPRASEADIQEAYEKAKRTYSLKNDNIYNVFSEQEASAWLQLIEEAYSVIGHPKNRELYNQELHLGLQSSETLNVPEGYGETPLSIYPVDPQMEEVISSQDLFDGLFLKKIRLYKQVDLNEFSRKTCIAVRHLYSIENNNFSVLPAPVFVRGYIIQYCRVLGLDEKVVVSSFMSLLNNEKEF